MTSKNYTNLILTVIAVLLIGILFKGFSSFPLENRVLAGDEKYKEFKTVRTRDYDANGTIQENVKSGWKPLSIAQSKSDGGVGADLTILFAK